MRLYNYLEGLEVIHTNVTRFDIEIKGVTSRSSQVEEGYIFVCVKGLKADGHNYIFEAKTRGAALLVVSEATDSVVLSGLPYIMVKEPRKALTLMCAIYYGNPQKALKLIGVTGTNGKTSTCALLSEIYRKNGADVKTLGTLDGGLTTPDPEELFKTLREAFDGGADTVIMEASSHALHFDKLYGISFANALFTNLTSEHLDLHGNMTEYALTKAKLFAQSKKGLYNLDDSYYSLVSEKAEGVKYTYSATDRRADFYTEDVRFFGSCGVEYNLVTPKESFYIKSSLCGRFNLYNTLAAAALAYTEGIAPRVICQGVESVKGIKGRLERVEAEGLPLEVYIDYAHTPDALENLLTCVREFREKGQRIILIFGCGGDRDKSKRQIMGRVASSLADICIVTADNSRSEKTAEIIKDILKGIDKERPYKVIENRSEAIEYGVNLAQENDIILLAGKGHEDYEIDAFGKRYFNEKEIAYRAIKKRFKGK